LKPPISPRRAFLYSALVPGYGQAILGRHKAAAAMLVIEAMAVAMVRESAADVREARRMSGDTVVILSYVDPSSGQLLSTPSTVRRRFDSQYVHVRQSHVEDWVAFLFANHLFSGADAFVAASLWELPAELSVRVAPGGATVGASLAW
jgi:predicted branched-subunit amino acid permease